MQPCPPLNVLYVRIAYTLWARPFFNTSKLLHLASLTWLKADVRNSSKLYTLLVLEIILFKPIPGVGAFPSKLPLPSQSP